MSGATLLETLIAPAVQAQGYRLVRLRLMGGKRKTLQILAERPDGQMDVEDCAKLSRAVSEVLGLTNIAAKCHGSTTPYNVGRATRDGLVQQRRPSEIAAKRGKTVAEIA